VFLFLLDSYLNLCVFSYLELYYTCSIYFPGYYLNTFVLVVKNEWFMGTQKWRKPSKEVFSNQIVYIFHKLSNFQIKIGFLDFLFLVGS